MVLAIVEDLIFRGKGEAAAKELGAALRMGQGWSRVLIEKENLTGDAM